MGGLGPVLPENLLRCMSPEDRRALGKAGRTAAEARDAAIVKSEKELQKQIADYLRLRGIWFTQSRMDRKTSNTVGTPDFLLCVRGRFVAWEVKCPWSRVLRPEQAQAAGAIERNGGAWRLITSLAEAKEHLEELGWRP